MLVGDAARLPPVGRFLYWVREREAVRLRKEAGKPKPWTDDAVLQTQYFTNVRREDDRVTRWFRDNVRDPLRDDSAVWFATVAFRWFNWPDTGAVLLGKAGNFRGCGNLFVEWDLKEATRRLRNLRDTGLKVFSGAYNISNGGSRKSKIQRVCEDYVQPAWEHRHQYTKVAWFPELDLNGCHGGLSALPGMGGSGFMAAQVVADLKYTYFLHNADDWVTWCCPGPGSIRGLNVVLGRPAEAGKAPDFVGDVNRLRQITARKHPSWVPQLHAQDVQNCLCEFFKYDRALRTGKSKRRYVGV